MLETIEQFRGTASDETFAIVAYCLMPDHAHLLVEGTTEASDLRRFVKLAKQRSGAAYALKARRRLWQKGYHDRVLREDDDTKTFARYVLENPVRSGLVVDPMRYPHSGSDVWKLEDLFAGLQCDELPGPKGPGLHLSL